MKIQYYSNVKGGLLQNNVLQQIEKDLPRYEGKRIHIIIDISKSTRSHQQNKYWWALMTIIGSELGYTKEEMHEICKFKFLKREKVHEATGEIMEYLASSTTLNKTDFADMTNGLIRWASESFSIVLPLPNEQIDMEL